MVHLAPLRIKMLYSSYREIMMMGYKTLVPYPCKIHKIIFHAMDRRNWKARVREKLQKYGPAYWERFCMLRKEVGTRYYNIAPGEGLNYSINKRLCGQFAQGALDSQHKTSERGREDSCVENDMLGSRRYVYAFDMPLSSEEIKILQKDLRNFTLLEDILDLRKCREFTVLVTDTIPRRYCVSRTKSWHKAVRQFCGGFHNLLYCTDVRGFNLMLGDLAGAVNFANILTEFEMRHPGTDLTIILLNAYFLNEATGARAINRYGTAERRSFLSQVAFEKTQKNLEAAKAEQRKDNLEENYVRIMMQQDPLVGSNFNGFQLLTKKDYCTTKNDPTT